MSAENDILFPHSETLLFEDQSAVERESSLDGLLRGDLLPHEAGNGGLCDILLQISNNEPVLQKRERIQDESLLSYPQKFKSEPTFGVWETAGKPCRTQACHTTCDMLEISTISDTSDFGASVCRNNEGCLVSLIGKAESSSSETNPGNERLNYLSLQQIVEALDMKEESCSLPEGDPHLQPDTFSETAAEVLLLSSSNLSPPLVSISNFGRISPQSPYASDFEPPELVSQTFVVTDCAFASGPSPFTPITHDLLPASLLTGSAAGMNTEPAFIGDEIQQGTLNPFKDSKALSSSPSLSNEDMVLDPTDDGLSPLPKSSLRPHPIRRSFSSHALGQTMTKTSTQEPSVVISEPADPPKSFQSTQSCMQPYPLELQTFNPRPLMPSMRRVYSTGDIQTFGRAGSPFLPKCLSQEEGRLRIGRYSSEERKVRISRYRQKRAERNFSKKIKYVCRKTLADNRPRVRGRFARNDDQADHEAKRREWKPDDEDDGESNLIREEEYFQEYFSRNPIYRTNFTVINCRS